MKIHTIGFTKKPAADFFRLLQKSGARRVIDVRLNNSSQLAGFAKKTDLPFFLREICGMDYIAMPDELAPEPDILKAYRAGQMDWAAYEREFIALMDARRVRRMPIKRKIANSVLLCSEHQPDRCHRRLIAEYLNEHWGNVEIQHLV